MAVAMAEASMLPLVDGLPFDVEPPFGFVMVEGDVAEELGFRAMPMPAPTTMEASAITTIAATATGASRLGLRAGGA
jgi:hypothetical protein